MPRALSSSAMACNVVAPRTRSFLMVGASLAACLSARALLSLPRLLPLDPEFTTGATRHFVRPRLHGHPNGTVAVNLEYRVQNDRPRASWTAAGYVENAISGDSKSVAP
jgi:hypothetical protein